jgi:cell division protein FtsQ
MKSAPASILRTRIVPAAAATVVLAAIAAGAWYGYGYVAAQPIQRVLLAGDVKRLAPKDLEAFVLAVQGVASSSASLAAVRDAARRIPWVREATVRRQFPDAIEVTFETHQALARWNDAMLVSVHGDVFSGEYAGFLPSFKGADSAAASMAAEYPAIARALTPLAAAITEVKLSARGAWQVTLDSGQTLDLGRGDIHPRLARFALAWPQLAARGVTAKHADLRYPNGFTVSTK